MYWTLFLTFVKIGTFTIGGGYAMLPLIQREVVDKGWLSKEDFIDLFSVAQSLPGIFAVNISIFVGYKLKKVPGGIVCALGSILPRSEERRVGKECLRLCRSRWSPYH